MKKKTFIISALVLTVSFSSFAQEKKDETKETKIKTKSKTTKEDGKVTESRKVTEADMDDKHVRFVKEKGELTELTVDGKKIEKENFRDYKELILKIENKDKKVPHIHDPNKPHQH